MLQRSRIAFINDLDVALALGVRFDGDGPARRAAAARLAFETFPGLETIACTLRETESPLTHTLTGFIFTRAGEHHVTAPRRLEQVVDRVGGGDSFAAGVLAALGHGHGPAYAAEFGLANAALKHAVPGDFNPSNRAEVEALLAAGGLDVRR